MNLFLMNFKKILAVKHFSASVTHVLLAVFSVHMFCHGIIFLTLVYTLKYTYQLKKKTIYCVGKDYLISLPWTLILVQTF